MSRDAEATRARLIAAARAEFAAYGIAGARVDRIAAAAASNKAQIYHYFGSKEQLFDAVFAALAAQVVAEVPIDVEDLPRYAANLARGYDRHPDVGRLVTWQRLERSNDPPIEAVVASNQQKVAAIARAQAEGRLADRYQPEVLLALILHMASFWASLTPEFAAALSRCSTRSRYQLVADAVADLIRS